MHLYYSNTCSLGQQFAGDLAFVHVVPIKIISGNYVGHYNTLIVFCFMLSDGGTSLNTHLSAGCYLVAGNNDIFVIHYSY